VALSGAMATLRNGNASGNGAIRNGGITKGGGARASISTWGPLPIFNQVVEFFHEL